LLTEGAKEVQATRLLRQLDRKLNSVEGAAMYAEPICFDLSDPQKFGATDPLALQKIMESLD